MAGPVDPAKTALMVGGTPGDDKIILTAVSSDGTIGVAVNGASLGTFRPTGRVYVYAQGGDDQVNLNASGSGSKTVSFAAPAVVLGGDGNDSINAVVSTGNNVLVGGSGNDKVIGGSGVGRDILIGGLGADELHDGNGDDIVIGGTTAYDGDVVALCTLLAEWARGDLGYADRANHLTGVTGGGLNGSYLLNRATVLDDAAADTLFGAGGQDWFLAHVSGVFVDTVSDQKSGETVTTV